MFLLIFRYVFGGAIDVGTGVSYVDFLVPGFVVTTVLFVGLGRRGRRRRGRRSRASSTGCARLPISAAAGVAGRALADTAVGLGARDHDRDRVRGRLPTRTRSAGAALAAFGLCVRVRLRVRMGVHLHRAVSPATRRPRRACRSLVFPLTFVSSAYVPVATMPAWMRAFAEPPADHGHDECGPLPHAGQRGHRAPRAHRGVVRGGVADLGGRARSGVRPDRGVALLAGQRVSGLYLMRCGWSASAPRRLCRSFS